jgi:hypothetical protein
MSPRELGRSPKESNVRVTHSSPLGREDIRPDGVEQTTQTSLEIPVTDEVSEPLQDGVDQDHVSPRELEESPKGAREIVPRPSNGEHDDMQEAHSNKEVDGVTVESIVTVSSQADILPTVSTHEVAVMQRHEVPPECATVQQHGVPVSHNVQHDLDLWARIREYDQRMAAEGFTQVLSKKQQKDLKKQVLVGKPSYNTRTRGTPPSSSS